MHCFHNSPISLPPKIWRIARTPCIYAESECLNALYSYVFQKLCPPWDINGIPKTAIDILAVKNQTPFSISLAKEEDLPVYKLIQTISPDDF